MNELPSINTATPNSEILQLANEESLAFASWCMETISERHCEARLPPDPWAGRDEIVRGCAAHFTIPEAIAGNAVDQAVMQLWHRPKADPKIFRKQAMKLRIIGLKQLVFLAIKNGRKEEFFKYVALRDLAPEQWPQGTPKNPDLRRLVEIKVKEKRYTGTGMGAIHMAASLERMLADLDNLDGDTDQTSSNVIQDLIDGLDKLANSKKDAEEDKGSSVAARSKRLKMDALKPEHQRLLESIMKEPDATVTPQPVAVVRKMRGREVGDRDEVDGADGDNAETEATDGDDECSPDPERRA
jgi:hypothetical protein